MQKKVVDARNVAICFLDLLCGAINGDVESVRVLVGSFPRAELTNVNLEELRLTLVLYGRNGNSVAIDSEHVRAINHEGAPVAAE